MFGSFASLIFEINVLSRTIGVQRDQVDGPVVGSAVVVLLGADGDVGNAIAIEVPDPGHADAEGVVAAQRVPRAREEDVVVIQLAAEEDQVALDGTDAGSPQGHRGERRSRAVEPAADEGGNDHGSLRRGGPWVGAADFRTLPKYPGSTLARVIFG